MRNGGAVHKNMKAPQSINNGDLDDVLDQLDDKITEIGFNRDYTLNEIGLKLQKLYDELYVQNC